MLAALPQYSAVEVSLPTPAYSVSPLSSEVSIKGEILTGSPSSAHFRYLTKHMDIDLGPRIWGSPYPCYGLNGRVEGSIRFSGMPRHVKRVSVTVRPTCLSWPAVKLTCPRIIISSWRAWPHQLPSAARKGNMFRRSCPALCLCMSHSKRAPRPGRTITISLFQYHLRSTYTTPCLNYRPHSPLGTLIWVSAVIWRTS